MPTTPNETIAAFKAEYGFEPSRVYCERTGKPIGYSFNEEFASVLNLVCESNDGADEAADDLATRCLASMRPSLKWNKFRAESLAQMRKTDPKETLAYLINRMFAPHNRLQGGMLLRHYEERIKAWQRIDSWGVTDDTNTLAYMLLEIDAKMGLDTEQPPFNWKQFFDAESMKHRIEMLQGWYVTLMERWEVRLKHEEMQTRWMRYGNVLAKPAFRDAYMESQPLSATAIKKASKKAEKDFFAGILWEVMGKKPDESAETVEAVKPKPQIVPLPRRKNPFARKDS